MNKTNIATRCIFIDLEIDLQDKRIKKLAAIRGDRLDEPYISSGNKIETALKRLDHYTEGIEFVAGHNLIAHDLKFLQAAAPTLRIISLPPIDTLRLSPLAFPRNPYHRLVKHYKEGSLLKFHPNNPELDARISQELLNDEIEAFHKLSESNTDLCKSLHWLVSTFPNEVGFADVFSQARSEKRPTETEGRAAITRLLSESSCSTKAREILDCDINGWPMAYALVWFSVAGGNSVLPPWVRFEFPESAHLIRLLRDTGCGDKHCAWCSEHHNPKQVLKRWFGFSEFRAAPVCEDGSSMQEAIVSATMQGENTLGILPTGTGKSVCYQVPALARYANTGAITVVISPLVALMEDQVQGIKNRGIDSCAALNGLLSQPERADVLERVRLGNIAILLASPEQLRNKGFRSAIQQREIGAWVIDEAHCLSKWGQDFRTDYRYIGRFIKESAGNAPIPPVLCLTATAKPDVVAEIRGYFLKTLGIELKLFNGGTERTNIEYSIFETTPDRKLSDLNTLLEQFLPDETPGGAIVYCSTRTQTEEISKFLSDMKWNSDFFHAGLTPERKKNVQKRFIEGELRVIVATNAFGMGIDKPDVRLVIHADIPGSLENYIQEAGRAGRDQKPARCILLFCNMDVEKQFSLSAMSRLPLYEIQAILRTLRRMAGKRRPTDKDAEVYATPGEIIEEDEEKIIDKDSLSSSTRVYTAIAWLEEAQLIAREENHYAVFPSTLQVPDLEKAKEKLADIQMPLHGQLMAIVEYLLFTDPTEGVSTDELMETSRLSSKGVVDAMRFLERRGILVDNSIFTALVHVGVENSSLKRLDSSLALETAIIGLLQETAPDLTPGDSHPLFLRRVSQRLKDDGFKDILPERIHRLLKGFEHDATGMDQIGPSSLRLRKIDAECLKVTLLQDWNVLRANAETRHAATKLLLLHFLSCAPPSARGYDLQAKTTKDKLFEPVESDLLLKTQVKDIQKLIERSLLWLHDLEILRLGRGLIVFRPAMRIRVAPGISPFNQTDYAELKEHYDEQKLQINVMTEYAHRGVLVVKDAMKLAADYFSLQREKFIEQWFSGNKKQLFRQTTNESWKTIVGNLNREQHDIVADEREKTNILVLAGPGSGKTRVIVHRIAFLIRARRENPRGVLALTYNRHAAVEIRERLKILIGEDASGVTVLTCHALAMRLTGASFAERAVKESDFANILIEAANLLKDEDAMGDETDSKRERLLSGFRWIFVDEYQDIGQEQYNLISALAGRTLNDPDRKLSLFAVGDDDQNVYEFAGASVEYIRRFQEDYHAKPMYLTANYRSTANIINVSNSIIDRARERMKRNHPITIDPARVKSPMGGSWEDMDPITKGFVQILRVNNSNLEQAEQVVAEMSRISSLDPDWKWTETAVIARHWESLHTVMAFCEANNIPVQRADRNPPHFWFLRETQALVELLSDKNHQPIERKELHDLIETLHPTPWRDLLGEALNIYTLECGETPLPAAHLKEWLAEWGREIRQRRQGVLLATAHRIKGLEFDHIIVLDGDWRTKQQEDPDSARRLFYVAMTRARKTLTLVRMKGKRGFTDELLESPFVFKRIAPHVEPNLTMNLQYEILSPSDVDLGYMGRFSPDDPRHAALASIKAGNPLSLENKEGRWRLNANGHIVGRLSNSYTPPKNMRCVKARVHAILKRFATNEDPKFANMLQCEQWEVVLPELIFAPEAVS